MGECREQLRAFQAPAQKRGGAPPLSEVSNSLPEPRVSRRGPCTEGHMTLRGRGSGLQDKARPHSSHTEETGDAPRAKNGRRLPTKHHVEPIPKRSSRLTVTKSNVRMKTQQVWEAAGAAVANQWSAGPRRSAGSDRLATAVLEDVSPGKSGRHGFLLGPFLVLPGLLIPLQGGVSALMQHQCPGRSHTRKVRSQSSLHQASSKPGTCSRPAVSTGASQ